MEAGQSAGASGTLVIRTKQDVYRFINETTRSSGRNRLLLFAALASLFVDSWDLAGFGAGIPSVIQTFHLSAGGVGLLTTSIGIGAVLAAVAGGYLVDRIGRLRMFVLDMVLFVVSAAVGAVAPNPQVLFFARFLMGVGIGLDVPAALSMVAEHSHVGSKRTNVNQNMVYTYYANIAAYIVSFLLVVTGHGADLWRIQVALGGLVALVIIVIRLRVAEESAFWLASRGELHAAADVIQKAFHVRTSVQPIPTSAVSRRGRYSDIFRGAYLARTILSTEINLFQSIVYFAVGFYLPVTIGLLFKSPAIALIGTAGINLFGLAGSASSAIFANRVGLRRQAVLGFALEVPILVLLGVGIMTHWLPPLGGVVLLIMFLLAHTFGPAQTGISIAALSFPTELRGQGTGFSYGIGRVGAVVGGFIFPLLLAGVGLGMTMVVLALAPLLGCLIGLAIVWEPTGVEADEESGIPAAGTLLATDVVFPTSG